MANTEGGGGEWAETLVKRFGRAAKRIRGKRSAKWLSDQTEALGYRISPTVIAKLDSGHRGANLSVPELLVIAGALDVPPAILLFPDLPDGTVELLPGRGVRSIEAIEWLDGSDILPPMRGAGKGDTPGEEFRATRLLYLSRQQARLMDGIATATIELIDSENSGDMDTANSWREHLRLLNEQFEFNRDSIVEIGGVLKAGDDA